MVCKSETPWYCAGKIRFLNPRNEFVKPWNELTDDEKKVYARYMEVYAGFLEHADAQIGKVVDYLKEIGEFENTVIVLLQHLITNTM